MMRPYRMCQFTFGGKKDIPEIGSRGHELHRDQRAFLIHLGRPHDLQELPVVFANSELISRVAVTNPSDARIKNLRKTRNSPQYNGHAKPFGVALVAPSNRQNP